MNRDRVTRIMTLRTVARRQHGLFTLGQAQAAGFDTRTIRRRLAEGVWEEPAPRVYRSAGVPMRWDDELLALVLSAEAVAARKSAAALYQLLDPPKHHHLLVARGRRNLERVVVHSSYDIPASDVTKVGVLPATTPVRTVIDVAGELPRHAVERLVDRAISRRLVRVVALERRARELRAPGRPGAARVLRALADAHPDLEQARNEFEGELLRLLRAAGLPDPIPNYRVVVGGQVRYLDAAWPEPMASLELDGYLPHIESRDVFDDDRVRQNELVDAGWKVFRVTPRMLKRPRRVLQPIVRAVLANESHDSGACA